MAETKGHCKHGEFIIRDGCPQCIEERRQAGITPALDELEDGLNKEGLTLTSNLIKEEPAIETAIVKIAPGKDKAVITLHKQALKLIAWAEVRVIATPDDLKPATDDLSVIAKLKRLLEDKRKEYVKPPQDCVKEINEAFRTLMEPIERADSITRYKILAFNQEQERIRREQEEVNRLRMEAAQKEMALKGEITKPVGLVDVSPEAPTTTRTDMGTVGQRDNWKYEVVDFAQLPDEYKIPDSAMLNAVAKKHHGKKQIPGVRFYNEPIIAVRAR